MQGVIRRLPKAGCELPNGTGYWAKYTDMRAMMPVSFDGKLVVAISSRALFNLADSHRVYLEEGLEAFQDYQTRHEDDVLEPGDAFPLVQKLLAINELKEGKGRVEVILLSRNSSDTGLRVFNSIEHYGLPITRAAFAGGRALTAMFLHSAPICSSLPIRMMCSRCWKPVTLPRRSFPVASASARMAFCGSPLTAMPCCFPMSLNRFSRVMDWKPLPKTRNVLPVSPWTEGPSNPSWRHCINCRPAFPWRPAQSGPPW